jgi:hypothetical protein
MSGRIGATWRPGYPRACGACGAALVGARTLTGATAPVTIDSKDNGNVLVFSNTTEDPPVLECRTLAGETLRVLREQRVPLKLNHFADCPSADKFRRDLNK